MQSISVCLGLVVDVDISFMIYTFWSIKLWKAIKICFKIESYEKQKQ